MSVDFYDSKGRAYAYCDDGEIIYTFSGTPIAYFSKNSIYAFNGIHIGYYTDELLRDNLGNILLFSNNASRGPIKPIKHIKPIKSIKKIKPIKGIKQIKPIRPIQSNNWSSFIPEEVFES